MTRRLASNSPAFTLLELLAVIGVILLVLAFSLPAIAHMRDAGNLRHATSQIALLIEHARSHAMTNNTHVFLGFQETDTASWPGLAPDGTGRVIVAMFECPDGTRGYSFQQPQTTWPKGGSHLRLIGTLWRFDGVHLAESLGAVPATGPMGLEAGRQNVNAYYRLGNPACAAVTEILWPSSVPEYRFRKVIHFSPQGVARIQFASNGDETKRCIEIGLQICHGNAVPPAPADANIGQQTAIQINCPTGTLQIFTP